MKNSPKLTRPPSRPGKSSTVPRRPGMPTRGRKSQTVSSWQWIAIGFGGLLLTVALLFGARALFAPKPTPTPFLPTATPPGPVPTETPLSGDIASTPSPTPTVDAAEFVAPDIPALQRVMLEMINADRRAEGLREVVWDETAALAGTQHAKEMAQYGFISHRNLDGYGPEYRYSMAGGLHYSVENVYAKWHSPGGGPRSATEWEQWVREAQESLMGSEGHRANILAPEHTHVGVGLSYNSGTGYFAIAQEFVNQYVTVQPLLRTVALGQQVDLTGWLNVSASDPQLNIAYEPLPTSLSLQALKPETYLSLAQNYDTPSVRIAEDGKFTASFRLNNADQPGLYHIRLWVNTEFGQVQALNLVIRVQ